MTKINYRMAAPYFPDEEIEKILPLFREILEGKRPLSQSEFVREFERAFAAMTGCRYAVATNSCSAALEIALRCLNITSGDDVVVPVETFIATGAIILREGANPVFAGISPETFCLSLKTLQAVVTPKTKAVIIVHMAGFISPEIFAIRDFCRERGIALIEDAAHAPGAAINGEKAGSIGDIGCFSFYPTKVMTTAEGGMFVTNNESLYELANSYRHRGRDMSAKAECYSRLGTNNRMTEFSAILGLSQLSCLNEFIDKRNRVADYYGEFLAELFAQGKLNKLVKPENIRHAYWRFIVGLEKQFDRVEVQKLMKENGVAVDWAYDPPLHLQPVFRHRFNINEGYLSETEEIMKHFICLPIHPFLTREDIAYISRSLTEVLESLSE